MSSSLITQFVDTTNIRGTLEPQFQSGQVVYDQSSGYVRKLRYRGLGPLQMEILANSWNALQCGTTLTEQFGVYELEIIDTRGETRIDTWEMAVNRLSPNSLENPRNIATVAADDLLTIAKMETGEITYDEALGQLDGSNPFAERLLTRIKKGSNQYYKSSYILRHKTNVSNRYNINIADTNVDSIYTTAQLLSEAQDPNLWIFPLPGELVFAIQYYDANNAPDPVAFYLWGWLKTGSSRTTCVNNRIEIATEFEAGQWSTDEYAF